MEFKNQDCLNEYYQEKRAYECLLKKQNSYEKSIIDKMKNIRDSGQFCKFINKYRGRKYLTNVISLSDWFQFFTSLSRPQVSLEMNTRMQDIHY